MTHAHVVLERNINSAAVKIRVCKLSGDGMKSGLLAAFC